MASWTLEGGIMSVRPLWAYISHLVQTVHLLNLGNLDISHCSALGLFIVGIVVLLGAIWNSSILSRKLQSNNASFSSRSEIKL